MSTILKPFSSQAEDVLRMSLKIIRDLMIWWLFWSSKPRNHTKQIKGWEIFENVYNFYGTWCGNKKIARSLPTNEKCGHWSYHNVWAVVLVGPTFTVMTNMKKTFINHGEHKSFTPVDKRWRYWGCFFLLLFQLLAFDVMSLSCS